MGENAPVSALETIEKAMEGVTPGPWQIEGKYVGDLGSLYLSTMHPSPIFELVPLVGTEGRHIANAQYLAACSPVAMREVLALARQAEALKREKTEMKEALQNLMGCYDTPLSRRRFPPDDFMKEALNIARALLGGENADN